MNTDYIENLKTNLPKTLDLTNELDLEKSKEIANNIFNKYTIDEINGLEIKLSENKDANPLMLHLAIKLAKSKKIISQLTDKIHVSVVFAVYKEHNRMKTKKEHEHGENFIILKISQLNWLFGDYNNFSWNMVIVDDGCPENSGKIAQEILNKKYKSKNVEVLFLEEAIKKQIQVTQPLSNTNQSRKGGSIEYGMWHVAQEKHDNHIIVFTDADLSTHLGQTGLLVDGIISENKRSAIGSRRENLSIVIKKGVRNNRGKLFIYLWKRMLPNLNYIIDTQCGFKAFKTETVKEIINETIEKQFAFDIELLLKTELIQNKSISKIPIAWIDSEAASTTTDLQPYLSMLKSMVLMYKKYLQKNEEANSFANFIDSLDENKWNKLVDNIPQDITSREPAEFDKFNDVKVADLQAIIN